MKDTHTHRYLAGTVDAHEQRVCGRVEDDQPLSKLQRHCYAKCLKSSQNGSFSHTLVTGILKTLT